jgi:hypothetical protein
MRRSIALAALTLLAATTLLVPGAVASSVVPSDDPEPPVLGPPPEYSGVDLAVRAWSATRLVGVGTNSTYSIVQSALHKHSRVRTVFRVCGRHADVGRVVLDGDRSGRRFHASYRTPSGKDVTDAIVRGRYRTKPLAQGECARIIMTVRRTAAAHRGDSRRFPMAGHAVGHPNRRDEVGTIVYAGPLHAQLRSATVVPPAGFRGTDLVITSISSHAGACGFDPDGPWYTGACRDGRFLRGKGQAVIQPLGDLEGSKAVARVGVWNFQPHARRITLRAAGSTRGYRVRYVVRHHDVTSRMVAGTYRTPRIAPGTVLPVRVIVTTRRFVTNGKLTDFFVRAKRKVITTSSGAELVIPGDVVTDRVASAPYDALPGIFPPPPA